MATPTRTPCPTTVSAPSSAIRPATARNTAGAAAQRCGWSLNRTDRTASNAQPTAKPSSATPVSTSALAGMNGAATRATATTRPAIMDADNDPTDADPERTVIVLRSLDTARGDDADRGRWWCSWVTP